jgi:HsdM-like protein
MRWVAPDQFRANSGLKAGEYSGPVLGLIFLRFAEARFAKRRAELEKAGGSRGQTTFSCTRDEKNVARPRRGSCDDQSTFAPVALMIFENLAASVRMTSANPSGVLLTASSPNAA